MKNLRAPLAVLSLTVAFAGPGVAYASPHLDTPAPTVRMIQAELRTRKSSSFGDLLTRWQSRYATSAVEPLLAIARDRGNPDADRYVAIMGAAKLGGRAVAGSLAFLLDDPAWMVRNATLRSLRALGATESLPAVIHLFADPALVIRTEALDTARELWRAAKPTPATDLQLQGALYEAALAPANYHGGKALWVPQRALAMLGQMPAAAGTREWARLAPLLERAGDPDVQRLTVRALNSLTGQSHTLASWRTELARKL